MESVDVISTKAQAGITEHNPRLSDADLDFECAVAVVRLEVAVEPDNPDGYKDRTLVYIALASVHIED